MVWFPLFSKIHFSPTRKLPRSSGLLWSGTIINNSISFQIFSVFVFVISCSNVTTASEDADDVLRIHRAANQLIDTQLASGFFPYDFNFASGVQSDTTNPKGYHLVRQAGAAFVLGEYLERYDKAEARNTLVRYLERASSNSIPVSKGAIQKLLERLRLYNRWRFWEFAREPLNNLGLLFKPEGEAMLVSIANDYERAWLGTTALSLIAAVKYYQATKDGRFNQNILAWKDGLITLRVPGRGFREAPHYLSEAHYFNGESWLALAEYVVAFPDDEAVSKLLVALDEYMIERYSMRENMHFFSWGMMAAWVRFKSTGDPRLGELMQSLAGFFFRYHEKLSASAINTCAENEGVVTFVHYMSERNQLSDPLALKAIEFVDRQMAVNRQLQIDRDLVQRLPNGTEFREQLNKYRGAFIGSLERPLMQVDLTQHCLNALMRLNEAMPKH